MAHVERIRVYPVKALDGIELDAAEITAGGTLAHDREYGMFDPDGDPINGKRTDRVHDLRTDFDPDTHVLTVRVVGGDTHEFELADSDGRDRAADWFGDFFDESVTVRRDAECGFVDRRDYGPSVVSTATLETVASWFDGVTVDGMRRRLRANVEIGGVPAFWEDRFVGEGAPAFRAGDVRIEGVTPCGRCVVPQRDPDTGERTPNFRERFLERRRATFPDWADADAFEHYYTLMLIARIPDGFRDRELRVGDDVEVLTRAETE